MLDSSFVVITPEVISFQLNSSLLTSILQAKNSHLPLSLKLLPLNLSLGITFCTYYNSKAIARTVIFPQGHIITQFSSDSLSSPDFTRDIIIAHNWLIDQVLAQLTLNIPSLPVYLPSLSWGFSIVIVAVVIFLNLPLPPLLLLPFLPLIWFLQFLFTKILRYYYK